MSARCLLLMLLAASAFGADPIVIGSKTFAENYILAEAGAQLLESKGYDVDRRFGLNGTTIAFEALKNEAIDLYPEYTGTITEVILVRPELASLSEIRDALDEQGLQLLNPLGFNNAYAIATSAASAKRFSLRRISDLRNAPPLRIALPHEFMSRQDGWPGLQAHYQFERAANGIEHGLAYEAIRADQVDVIAVYTSDGQIVQSDLVILDDDLGYFPQYLAAFLTRKNVDGDVLDVLELLGGRLDDRKMRELNLAVLDPNASYADIAYQFLRDEGLISASNQRLNFYDDLVKNTRRHLKLTTIALAFAIVTGVGIASVVYRRKRLADAFLYFTGLLQTVPSIALLALLIPVFGVGQTPAIIALFLYSLLPIARSTITAMLAIPASYRQVAAAMAMTPGQEMKFVLMPLAMPHVIAGIRTAAVISIGTATLAAFIGAGGLGDPIVTGLALNDTGLILQGAVPAAGLAILTEILFGFIERSLVVPHMRSSARPT
ncbi:MAG: ABC transporter permease subunit [Proteobacteria bacterium]|nr:ABC transporter permease subunit [Pseudomonadota bacterium]MDA0993158.1 ABC transporter permease subunit [Pseudomonadota bacterium]